MAKTIYVLNGPNLNLLGTREPQIYGRATLKDVEKLCRKAAAAHGMAVEFRQSNHEGEIVDWIHEAGAQKAAGIVLNPAGLTHTSVSVHDAIKAVSVPVIETHITNIHAREPWRRALLCLVRRQGRDLRLRHPGLCAGDRRHRGHVRET